jgi:flagellar basal body-associated protein FliL
MAKKKKEAVEGDGEGEGKKSKKKLIIMVVVIMLIGGFVAKTILLKPKPPTPAQVADSAKVTEIKLENLCASHNGLPSQPLPGGAVADAKGAKGKDTSAATTTTSTTIADAPTPAGPVDTLDAITINLAAGHYLKVGLALQVPAGMDPTTVKTTENWEAVALKTVIDTLSGQTIDALSAQRQNEENSIGDAVCRKTDGKVLTIYFTDFVMQ